MDEEKKIERKQKRFAARLKSSKGIICSNDQCPNLVLYNVGQATGLRKDIIENSISKFSLNIKVPKYIMVNGESYSFLSFSNTVDASVFYNKFNGTTSIDESKPPVYMNYIENVPNTETVCSHTNPEGLVLFKNFISIDEERQFIELFDWNEDFDTNNLKNRQVRHFGYEFRYGTNDIDLNSPLEEKIPNECDILWDKLKKYGLILNRPDQLTVNKYAPGQGIPSHVDRHSPFGDTILSLSLGSLVMMEWRHHTGKYVPVEVPARSLLVMQGEARYDWQHGIQPRTWDPVIVERTIISGTTEKVVKVITNDTITRATRISLTFRWTRRGPCGCGYTALCDSVQKPQPNDIEDDMATNLEELHVHQVYEQIAGHFSTTRHKPWPKVVEFMSRVPTGSVVLDLGAGNGKNILQRGDILQVAGERSEGLVRECGQRTRESGAADCVRLDLLAPALRDRCADIIICVAVIHHFSNQARRLQAISTISRLLRTGGRALITVWAKDQTKSKYLCKNKTQEKSNDDLRVTVGGISLPVHENRTQFEHSDLLVPWKLRSLKENKLSNQPQNTLLRYYHVFEEGELESLCEQVPNITIDKSFYEEGNWCVVCTKI